MSAPDQWRDKLTFTRRQSVGMDPVLRVPRFEAQLILEDEPVDLILRTTTVRHRTNAGENYTRVRPSSVRIFPSAGPSVVPDSNDFVQINGIAYRVDDVRHTWDPGSGDYQGSVLDISVPEDTDKPLAR
jgi:hypothetical protein